MEPARQVMSSCKQAGTSVGLHSSCPVDNHALRFHACATDVCTLHNLVCSLSASYLCQHAKACQ